jgi:hypothetical protein
MQMEYMEEKNLLLVSGVESNCCLILNLENGITSKLGMDSTGMSIMLAKNK